MKSLYFIFFFAISLSLSMNSQDSFVNALDLTPTCYPNFTNDVELPPIGDLSALTSYFVSFEAPSQCVKIRIDAIDLSFSRSAKLYDNTYTEIADEEAGTGLLWADNLTEGNIYYVEIFDDANAYNGNFEINIEKIPNMHLRANYAFAPPGALEDIRPGYKLVNNLARVDGLFTGSDCETIVEIEETHWKVEDIDNLDVFEYFDISAEPSRSLEFLFQNNICYGKSYDVSAQVKIEGHWCGFSSIYQIDMEEEAYADFTTDSFTIIDLDGFWPKLSCRPLGIASEGGTVPASEESYEWEISAYNDTEITSITTQNRHLEFENYPCLLTNNSTFTARVRATYCGETGPWSDDLTFFTNTMPSIQLSTWLNNFVYTNFVCGDEIPLNSIIIAETYGRAEAYTFQIAEIQAGDPTMTPIAPAFTITQESPFLNLSVTGVEETKTYRVGVKWNHGIIGDADCIYQESDYGLFCPFTIGAPASPTLPVSEIGLAENDVEVMAPIDNSETMSPTFLNKSLIESNSNIYNVTVYDLSGRILKQISNIHFDSVKNDFTNQWNLSKGSYILVFENKFAKKVLRKHFF